MSWQLASFLGVLAVIVAGFAWYERSRPPSQVVALVAALAALAIAGRIAFAAFPNVKPTTDVVIFAGYALGGAPGFAVGALSALVSNFWFGQGPWTPWQMAGWGLCGVFGAALALGARRSARFAFRGRSGDNDARGLAGSGLAPRLTLAVACALAGLAYGALLNFSLMATYGGELSWATFWLYEGRAVPFEIAHAGGNFVLALLAGPAMLRMLARFRDRFEWRRAARGSERPAPGSLGPALRGGTALFIAAALALAAFAPTPARADTAAAVSYLVSQQHSDGGWSSSPGEASGQTTTAWVMLALESTGRNPLEVSKGGKTAVDFLRAGVAGIRSPGHIAQTVLALQGAGVDPGDFGGADLVARLQKQQEGNGSFKNWPGSTAYAAMALKAAGESKAAGAAANWLRAVQNDDGGWGNEAGQDSVSDITGAAMQALAGSGAAKRGLHYLREQLRPSGGLALGNGFPVNTQSTAWAVQGIVAAGADPASFSSGGKTPLDYLAANQQSDGHYRYAAAGNGTSSIVANQTPIFTTAQDLPAAAGQPFPIAAVPLAKSPPKQAAPHASRGSSTSAGGANPSEFVPPGTFPESAAVPPPLPGSGTAAKGAESRPGKQGKKSGGIAPGKGPGVGIPSPPGLGTNPSEIPPSYEEAAPAPETRTAEPESSSDDDSNGVAGAILAGALAGCLLFALAWGGRRVWMRQRYGL